ncbi:restriction endonuclease [Mycolicibacter longobardus]|nr:restriction endonuclease [Mycolicibacter longobardus]
MRPVLASLADGAVRRSREVIEGMADEFDLTPEERAAKVPSGQRRIDNRAGWALSYLVQSGLIERPGRGLVQISDEGRAALDRFPERIDTKALEAYPAFVEFRNRKRGRATADGDNEDQKKTTADDEQSTPNDLAEQAERINRAAVEREVLAAALNLTPTGFEELVVRLLNRMGYGRKGSADRTVATGDGGIDGIISQDPLGLDRIYVQAKRYTDAPVDRPAIHGFAGALLSKQGDRGVFITTSRFTKGAIDEAERINARIELIDGTRLAELLVEHGVGVQLEQSVTLYRLDEDFFDSI